MVADGMKALSSESSPWAECRMGNSSGQLCPVLLRMETHPMAVKPGQGLCCPPMNGTLEEFCLLALGAPGTGVGV